MKNYLACVMHLAYFVCINLFIPQKHERQGLWSFPFHKWDPPGLVCFHLSVPPKYVCLLQEVGWILAL